MKYIILQSEGRAGVGIGIWKWWVGCALGLALFLSAAGSVGLATSSSTPMTQHQYLQWMAGICGDRLGSHASGSDYVNWARGKGMNPPGGWQLSAKLTKEVVAHSIVQLLNLAPRKGNFDAVRILEREGIIITTTGGFVTLKNFIRLIDDGFPRRCRPNHGGGNDDGDDDDDGNGNGNGNGHGDDDDGDRDDDDGPRPTPTKPGHGHGDDNHDHTGPPGHGGPKPGHGGKKGGHSDDD